MLTFKNFNIADWFSFYRVFAIPILLLLLLMGERQIFAFALLVSYSTDMIDGFLARKLKITSARGSQLDSLGDQLTFIMGLLGLLAFEYDFIKENYILILIAFTPYLIQLLIAYSKYGKATAFHTYLAKLSAIVQGVFILWALFLGPIYSMFYVMIVIGFLETIEEVALIYIYDYWVSDIKGVYWAIKDKRISKSKKQNYTNQKKVFK
ncbi:CDP-alcohol phosphatidyltransferase family protein [Aureibaculum algae]|uniref:CDP-alcohol phosphatidyltransferase family protein n=1 Tax=Aureibaculum algae TaxID=2584122 RepID=A0A5B7TUD4_9FLAO|nr:CDP-alcohol phosphatidyltransferase family protein [Aureibaculum algae]QCX38736.1 CDP-alcohol phosphatidyltransferase family protein [Aureibaculum algae]